MSDAQAMIAELASGFLCEPDPCKSRVPNACRCAAMAAEFKAQLLRLDSATTELANVMKALSDPAAVWANMLRGTIARPKALEHYEECTAKLEAAESRLDESEAQCASWKARHDMMELGRDALQSRLDEGAKEIQRLRAALLKRETETVPSSEFQRVCADRDSYSE